MYASSFVPDSKLAEKKILNFTLMCQISSLHIGIEDRQNNEKVKKKCMPSG